MTSKPVVLLAEELSPATVEALGPDFEIRTVDGTDRKDEIGLLARSLEVFKRNAIDGRRLAAEQDAEVFWQATVSACRALADEPQAAVDRIAGIALTLRRKS